MAIKLLLIEDVEDLGRSGDVVSVRPGFSRNYLLPNGYAVIADKNALRRQEKLQEERKKRAVEDQKEAEGMAAQITDKVVTTMVKVDQEGNMYGSVSALDVVHLLESQTGIVIEKRYVLLKHPIKEVGTHTINLKLKEGVLSSFALKIEPEVVPGTAPIVAAEEKTR